VKGALGVCAALALLLGTAPEGGAQQSQQQNQTQTQTQQRVQQNQQQGQPQPGLQQGGAVPNREMSASDINRYIMLARSSADYRVTPGDVYTLTYAAGTTAVTYVIAVDSSYRIRVSNLGVINGAGKTFVQLKNEAEAVVSSNYPLSGAQLALTQPAVFRVHIRGEVQAAGEEDAWALSRLSSLAQMNMTAYTSLRDVSVRASNGRSREYDLFKAQREGDLSQDPYLRPGDEVTFKRTARTAMVEGAVERPGTYQLLEGEGLKELIEVYGGGFSQTADRSRLELVRMVGGESVSGDKMFLGIEDLERNFRLYDYDRVTVPEITALLPVVFIEGAITVKQSAASSMAQADLGTELTGATRLVVPFNRGEDYAALVRKNKEWFGAESDTSKAYIIREGVVERIAVNLNPMLYDTEYRSFMAVQENDTLVIPFRQYFVTVAGAVERPGRYPYIPDREWDYYIGLAGGFVAGRNSREAVTIRDVSGKKLGKTDAVMPETVITAQNNNFLFYWGQIAPPVTTALSIISTFISILLAVNR
jgi:protein involved in polysaccharide export with SLBB domain